MSLMRVRFLWVFCAALLGVAGEAAAPAQAQSFFDFFSPGSRRAPPPRYYQQQQPRYYQYPPPQYNPSYGDDDDRWREREQRYRPRMRERSEVSSESPQWNEVQKDADAKNILVLGDQMAEGLAQGLREEFAADAKAVVKVATKEGASLVGKRADSFLQFVKEKITSENPSAIVVMLGINERKDMQENNKDVDFQSERWRTLYLEKVDALLQLLREKHVPVYWTGLPAARNKDLSGVMTYLNGLYQQKSYVRNAKYVDIWEGFVDEDGNYMIIGPDVNGNSRRLRQRDGVTLTAAGNRKLAFYVEKELRHDLSFAQPNVAAAPGAVPAAIPQETGKPVVGNAYVGPVISLNPGQGAEGAQLAGEAPNNKEQPETTGTVPLIAVAKPGRSDDFSWPPENRKFLPPSKADAKVDAKAEQKALRKKTGKDASKSD